MPALFGGVILALPRPLPPEVLIADDGGRIVPPGEPVMDGCR